MAKEKGKKHIYSIEEKSMQHEITRGKAKDAFYENFIYLIVISLLFLSAYAFIFDRKLDLNGDNAYYYVLGKALSQGEGYVNIANVNKPPNNHYPPGYPFILSLFMHISDSFAFLKLINGIFMLLSLYLLYYIFKFFKKSAKLAFVTVFFLLLNGHLLLYSTMMMSEMSFIVFSFLCLFFIQKTDFNDNVFKRPYIYLILVTLVGSYYIRSTGLALFVGLLSFLILKKYWKVALFIFIGFITLAAPWIIRGQKLGGSSYIKPLVMINPYRTELGNADFADYVNRILTNASRYITREIPSSTLPFIEVDYLSDIGYIEWVLGIPIMALIIFGLYKLGNKALIIICYIAATFGILLLWPDVWAGVRFVLPIVPLLLYALIIGIMHVLEYMFSRFSRTLQFNILFLLIVGIAFIPSIQKIHSKARSDYPDAWKNYFNAAAWLKRNNLQNSIVACRKPMLFHLNSGTFATTFKYSVDISEVMEDFRDKKIDYVVLDNLGYRQTYQYLFPAIEANQEDFEVALNLENPDTYLLKFNPNNE